MAARNVFFDLLEAGDAQGMMRVWRKVFPDRVQPKDLGQAEIMLHSARTQTEGLTRAARFYSHRWLTERGLPSALPTWLRPEAEQVHGKIVSAVGVAVIAADPDMAPAAKLVEKAMADAVADCYANGDTESLIVQARMSEARRKTVSQLLGR